MNGYHKSAAGHPAYRADDALWFFSTINKYVSETGNAAFLDEVIPYANKDEDRFIRGFTEGIMGMRPDMNGLKTSQNAFKGLYF